MKIIGKINIGFDILQVDEILEGFSHKAEKGTFIYDSLQNVREKTGTGNNEWSRTTFRVIMMNILTWAVTMLDFEQEERLEMVEDVLQSILTYQKGEVSPEGEDAVAVLQNECKLIGFVPSVTYIMHKERSEGSLEVFWEHPFSIPTLLYKHKKLPFLILSNGNIDFDVSRLTKVYKSSDKVSVPEGFTIEEPLEGEGVMG